MDCCCRICLYEGVKGAGSAGASARPAAAPSAAVLSRAPGLCSRTTAEIDRSPPPVTAANAASDCALASARTTDSGISRPVSRRSST